MRSCIAHAMAILVLMVSLLAGAVQTVAGANAGPALILPDTEYDFSEVYEGQNVRHDFVIQNKGTAAVDIISVKTD